MSTTPPTGVVISGALGRMGQALLRLGAADPAIRIVGALEAAGKISGPHGSKPLTPCGIPLAESLDALSAPPASVLVEFTTPEATVENVRACARIGLKAVVGTTGLKDEELAVLREASEQTAILFASNMSVGVNVLLGTVEKLASVLADFDIEIVEMHHRHKKDAPSGTALSLARAAAAGRGKDFTEVACYGREGMTGERPAAQIGIHAVRGGDVVGDHTVIFAREGERIELVHRAHSRDTFAAGALRAARFLADKPKGLFSMKDALGL